MDNAFLENYYEKIILPLYKDDSINAHKWKDHGRVGPDNWAHYFENEDGVEYVLLSEDYPGGLYLNDDLSHEVVSVPESDINALQVTIGNHWIPNVSGYFTLFKEKNRS